MTADPPLAFVVEPRQRPAIELRVNFGVFAGRGATPAEIDELARGFVGDVEVVTVVAEERHEFDARGEAAVHQVRIEVGVGHAPADEGDRAALAERLRAAAEEWAQACITDRHYDAADL